MAKSTEDQIRAIVNQAIELVVNRKTQGIDDHYRYRAKVLDEATAKLLKLL